MSGADGGADAGVAPDAVVAPAAAAAPDAVVAPDAAATVTPDAITGAVTLPGRTRVLPRALRTVAAAATAEALGVRPGAVRIDLADDRGLLRVSAASPIRVAAETTTPVLERAELAQTTVRDRIAELTGARISAVDLTITDAVLTEERRVR